MEMDSTPLKVRLHALRPCRIQRAGQDLRRLVHNIHLCHTGMDAFGALESDEARARSARGFGVYPALQLLRIFQRGERAPLIHGIQSRDGGTNGREPVATSS